MREDLSQDTDLESNTDLVSCIRQHAWLTVLCWCLFCLGLFAFGKWLGAHEEVPGPSSPAAMNRNAGERAAQRSGLPATDDVVFIISREREPVTASFWDSPEIRKAVGALVRSLRSLKVPDTHSWRAGQPLFPIVATRGHTLLSDSTIDGTAFEYLSTDRSMLLIRTESNIRTIEAAALMPVWKQVVDQWSQAHSELTLNVLSLGVADDEIFSLINRDLDRSLIVTIPLTLVVLWFVFKTPIAAFLPLFISLTSLAAALGGSAILSRLWHPISVTADQLVVLIVLAVGIDYALFLVSRYREECRKNTSSLLPNREHSNAALRTASKSTVPAIRWSGVTVALSLSGLLFMRDTVLTSMSVVTIIAVLITVVGATVALPALLALFPSTTIVGATAPTNQESARSWVRCLVTFGLHRPKTALLVSVVPLVALAAASFELRLGSTMERHLLPPAMQLAQAFKRLQAGWPPLAQSELHLIVFSRDAAELKVSELEERGELQPLLDDLLADGRVDSRILSAQSDDGRVMRFRLRVSGNVNESATQALVHKINEELGPKLIKPLGVDFSLSGNLGYVVTETDRYVARTSEVIGAVLLLSMVLLCVAFRSLVVPLKAVLLNLLSTACAFGALVLVFQSSGIAGFSYGVIEGFVPALLFAILFGLSMDYHVFLLARIREEYLASGDTTHSVERGILSTYRTISGAAAIMIVVFFVVATLELPIMRQLGLGLGVAVLLDATIIRLIIVPASMVLLGRYNWYLPGVKLAPEHVS